MFCSVYASYVARPIQLPHDANVTVVGPTHNTTVSTVAGRRYLKIDSNTRIGRGKNKQVCELNELLGFAYMVHGCFHSI